MRIGSARPSNPRTRSVGRATSAAEADIRSYEAPALRQVGHRITGDRTRQSSRSGKGGGAGWEFVQVCIDDASASPSRRSCPTRSRRAPSPSSTPPSLFREPRRQVQPRHDQQRAVLQSSCFRAACKAVGLKHIRTRPCTPRTNGKAERFIQTALREWAYAQAYPNSTCRAAELPIWLHRYNWHRPHDSLTKTAHQPSRFDPRTIC